MSEVKINIVTALAETFARKLTAPAAKLYVGGLAELTDEQAERAATIAVQKCKFFPSACELIELARTGGVSYEAQALVAFDELEHALDKKRPSLMPPLVAAIARQLGGFSQLHDMSISDFKTWKRKEFLAAYEALVRENPDRLAAIAGPSSDIAKALVGELKRLPSREDSQRTEEENRKKLVEAMG